MNNKNKDKDKEKLEIERNVAEILFFKNSNFKYIQREKRKNFIKEEKKRIGKEPKSFSEALDLVSELLKTALRKAIEEENE